MAENPHFAFGNRGVGRPTASEASPSLAMTTGLTLQHLYSQQQQYSQQGPQSNVQQPQNMSSHSHGGPPNNGHPGARQLPLNSMNKSHGPPGHLPHHHMNNGNQSAPQHGNHNMHNGSGNGEEFVADPLPFNYEEIEATGVFDDRYGARNGGNRLNGPPPNDKNHHAPPQQTQHQMRYGSLLSGMQQQQQYHDSNSYDDHGYDSRRDHNSIDRSNGHIKEVPSYNHYMPHSHAHSDHDSRPPSHYGIPELHSNMNHNNLHPLYHQPPPYANNNGPPQPPPHNPHSYSALMDSHHNGNMGSMPPPAAPQQTTTKKEIPQSYHNEYIDSRSHHSTSVVPHMPSSSSSMSHHMPPTNPSMPSQTQEAVIKVKTSLKNKYWRNGRRNLQCFPSCKVFGDYSQIKIDDLKQHDFMWGKCRGSLIAEVTLNSNATFDDILLLGRVHSLENIPVPFDEAVIRECMIGRVVEPDIMDIMKEQWIAGERLPDFINQNNNMACYEFKPKVWKYTDDMVHGKCKRRNVRYYVQFEAFVPVLTGDRRCYVCIGSGMSSSFEVGSSRVLARQKRKAHNNAGDEGEERESNEDYEQNEAENSRPAKKMAPMMNGYNI
ncbi:hypothetical protein LEN26_010334 [Aphanomyces euteiches]|nr:hypothetical protein LEN26_010334 [Aphanomyces euteiches]KAH9128049.1 hypothetical protein AeMF1_001745 [Aphanomyces euteiches]KAH9186620.1 hypothetical protein AeNC1_011404 [Aphanomyces euteiches]